jgi:hypothetical protein
VLRAIAGLVLVLGCTAPESPGPGAVPFRNAAGLTVDPFGNSAAAGVVLLFLREDCPIANRYAPTIRRIHDEFASRGIDFFLVYPDPRATAAGVRTHQSDYSLPGMALLDPEQRLVEKTGVTITPEAALFDPAGRLRYRGRIDDRFVDYGVARAEPTTHELRDALTALLSGQEVAPPGGPAIGCLIADLRSLKERP